MSRPLLKQFQYILALRTSVSLSTIAIKPKLHTSWLQNNYVHSKAITIQKPAVEDEDILTVIGKKDSTSLLNNDKNYITSYRVDQECATTSNVLVNALRTHFRLSNADVERILSDEVVHRSFKERSLLNTLETLCLAGVSKRSFVDYPWLLGLDKRRLEQKLSLLQRISYIHDINHFVPFLRLTIPRLKKLVSRLNTESSTVPYGNRVYYISERLLIDPSIVTKYLSQRLFILEMPWDMFEQNLQHMIDYNVSPMNLLKDLWAFRYTPKSVQMRLERAKRAKKEKIMPWMVRCPEPILQKSLKLSTDELQVLGEKSSVAEYVAERLQFSIDDTRAIMARHSQVNHVRVTKIKEVLDYLINEAGFTRYEIAQVPRILCHGLKTTKQRVEELKSFGCRPSTLVILCRSKKEYVKFLESWVAQKNQISKTGQPSENRSNT